MLPAEAIERLRLSAEEYAGENEALIRALLDTVSALDEELTALKRQYASLEDRVSMAEEDLSILFEDDVQITPENHDKAMYQVSCPNCGDTFVVDEDSMASGFSCPTCGERLISEE